MAAAGLDDVDLLDGAWDQLEGQFRTIGASAQRRALDFAGRIVGGMEPAVRREYGLRQAADLDEAWDWTKENLGALAKARLYHPDLADPELGEFDPSSRTPTGLVRQAMRRAGGVKGADNLTQISTSGGDVGANAWISVPDGSAPGGIATGQLIEQIVKDEGGSVPGYRWVYGPADRRHPFHPHLALDGLVFASFTDPRLVIGGGFPSTGHYIPGDHRGCICDVEPIFLTPEQVAQLREQGYLPDVPDVPGAAPPVAKAPQVSDAEAEFVRRHLREPTKLRFLRSKLDDTREAAAHSVQVNKERRTALRRLKRDVQREIDELPVGSEQRRIKGHRLAQYDEEIAYLDAGEQRMVELIAEQEAQVEAAEQAFEPRKAEALQLWRRQREDMPAGLSAKGADAWLAERWGTDYAGDWQRTIHFQGLGNTNGAEVARTAHDLMQRYTSTADRVLRLGDSATVTRDTKAALGGRYRVPTMKGAWADAWAQPGAMWIRMGPTTYDKAAAQWAVLGPANVANGFHPPGGDTIVSVFTHEFGHHVHYTALANAKAEGVSDIWARELADIKSRHLAAKGYDQTGIATRALIKEQVSEYALKNEQELFAEAFSYVETMGDDASPLAKELHALVVRWAEGDGAAEAKLVAEARRAGTRVS